VCDLETSRVGAPYIYDISRLRVKDKSGLGHRQLGGTVNTVINLQVPQNARNLPTSSGTINFSSRILLHGVSDIPIEISHIVQVHMVHISRSLTD